MLTQIIRSNSSVLIPGSLYPSYTLGVHFKIFNIGLTAGSKLIGVARRHGGGSHGEKIREIAADSAFR